MIDFEKFQRELLEEMDAGLILETGNPGTEKLSKILYTVSVTACCKALKKYDELTNKNPESSQDTH